MDSQPYVMISLNKFHLTSDSTVESLFSQLNNSTAGKLDAANYQTAQASLLVRQAVQDHHSGVGYRDGSSQVHTEAPKRKQHQRKNC